MKSQATFLQTNEGKIHYLWQDHEKEKTLLFLNSLGTDLRIWEGVIDRLDRRFNTLCFDKSGHGKSGFIPAISSMEDYAQQVVRLLDSLQIPRITLVGLSIGGMIAQQFCALRSQRVHKLILSNTAPKIGTAEMWNTRISAVREAGLSSMSTEIVDRWVAPVFKNTHADQLGFYESMLENTTNEGYTQACEVIRDADLTNHLSQIKLPTLCIGGDADVSTPASLVREMANKITNAQVEILQNTGHLPCIEQRERVAELIINFLQ